MGPPDVSEPEPDVAEPELECDDGVLCNGIEVGVDGMCGLEMPESAQVGCVQPGQLNWETNTPVAFSGALPGGVFGTCALSPVFNVGMQLGTVQAVHVAPTQGTASLHLWQKLPVDDLAIVSTATPGERRLETLVSPFQMPWSDRSRVGLCLTGPADDSAWTVETLRYGFGLPPYFGGTHPDAILQTVLPKPPAQVHVTVGDTAIIPVFATQNDIVTDPFVFPLKFELMDAPAWASFPEGVAYLGPMSLMFSASLALTPTEPGQWTFTVVASDGFFEAWHHMTVIVD
ncbi:MAG: hypothetical protein ACI9WU_000724 [Myxococcota bacterium]